MKSIVLTCLFVLSIAVPVPADDKIEVEGLLKNTMDRVIGVLQQTDLPLDEKNAKIITIVEPMFDFPLMAKLVLGKKYWRSLEKEKKKRFTALFVEKLKASYVDKLKLYTDEKVLFKEISQKKKKIFILTELVSNNNVYTMRYKFYRSKQGWKIYDIEIQGVSIISSYRSQSREILNKGTIEDLINVLETPSE